MNKSKLFKLLYFPISGRINSPTNRKNEVLNAKIKFTNHHSFTKSQLTTSTHNLFLKNQRLISSSNSQQSVHGLDDLNKNHTAR